jgi:Bacterial TSP3 repeat
MSATSISRRLLGLTLALAVSSCTDTYLYDQRRDAQLPRDRTLALEGTICTPSPASVLRPIKIVIAMDASQSMKVTDPDGTRAQAVVDLLNNLPQEPEVSFVVMLFAGSTPAWLSKSSTATFDRVVDYTDADRLSLQQRILSFTAPAANTNRDSTDFIKPLDAIYALINDDISASRLANANAAANYSVIFLSDGQPTTPEDDELLCGSAVTRIRDLRVLADDVKLNTVNVFLPAQPVDSSACVFDAGISISVGGSTCQLPMLPPGTCPLLIINQDAERLQQMATLGGGNFRDFRNHEPINFLAFNFGQVRRAYILDKLIASNFSAPADSPLDLADSDSDGLTDIDELTIWHTDPFNPDTDGDGFSDGVEVWARARGADFTPNQVALPDGGGLDPGCPPELRGVDSDCDGLTDCDEQIIGTNAKKIDTDDDGVPDSVEFKLGTQPSAKDLDLDPDNDLLSNGQELAMHTNPLVADADNLSTTAYRVDLQLDGGFTVDGQQCFTFTVSNVLLADTLPDTRDAGNPDGGAPLYRRGAGYNDIFVSVSMKSADDPNGHTLMRVYRNTSTRFPVGGIKYPHDGIIRINDADFSAGCRTATLPVP